MSKYCVAGVISEQLEIIALHENHIKTLNQEIKQHLLEQQNLNSTIKKTEKDRNNAIERGIVLEEKMEEAQGKIVLVETYNRFRLIFYVGCTLNVVPNPSIFKQT